MDDYRWNYHVPAFGSWGYGSDDDDGMPYTQCFESARQANLARFAYPNEVDDVEVRDLYVTGDLYQNSIVTPAVILVPRRRRKGGSGGCTYSSSNVKGVKKQQQKKQECGGYSSSYDIKQPPSPILSPPSKHNYNKSAPKSKPVDEDLYKIPPEFLHVKPKRKKGGLFSSCLLPACA